MGCACKRTAGAVRNGNRVPSRPQITKKIKKVILRKRG